MNNNSQQPSIKIKSNCIICNKEIIFFPCQKRKYCSHTCSHKSRIKEGTLERRREYSRKKYTNNKEYYSNWYQLNKERLAKKTKQRRNSEEFKKRRSEYMNLKKQTEEYKKYQREYQREWRAKNKEKVNASIRSSYKIKIKDPNLKMKLKLRNRLYIVLKNKNIKKKESTMNLLGCTIEEFKSYIESQWQNGMSWDNHGNKGWHIDHIKPCNIFDLTDIKQQKECFHYTNLRPLWYYQNLSRPKDGSDL